MSWHKLSALGSMFALLGCAGQQAPTAERPTVSGAGGALEGGTQQAARARLRAVIRDQSFLDRLPESERATTLVEPFSGRMVLLYTVDDRGAARGAQSADLVESGVTRDALRAVVEWNLANLLLEPVSCTNHSVSEPVHRHYYESSRLLLDKQWQDLAAKARTIVVAAPSNDTLFVACDPSADVLHRLAVVVQNTFPQASRPVSPSLLTWSKDGWQELPAR